VSGLGAATLCLILGARNVSLPTDHFTLAWTHSIEKIEWQEDYVLENARLVLTEARIQGTGAGMEPPPEARFDGGWWHYRPNLPPLPQLRLTLSSYTADYRLCWDGRCQPLRSLLGTKAPDGVVVVEACHPPRPARGTTK
jgi:hypothetical protein